MRAYLAAQVFNNRVVHALTEQGKPGTEEKVKFVKNMNDFFDCLNANRIYMPCEIKSMYCTPLHWRLHQLQNDFLKYLFLYLFIYFASPGSYVYKKTWKTIQNQAGTPQQ